MEIKVLEKDKTKVMVEVVGEDHTLCNVLRTALQSDPDVVKAVYTLEHPFLTSPKLIVETDGKKSPLKSLKEAITKIEGDCKEFKEKLSAALK